MADTFSLIASAVGAGLKQAGLTKPATLTKYTAGTRTAGSLSAGTNPTSAAYSAEGLVATDKYEKVGGTLVGANDRVVVLFGALISSGVAPVAGDSVTIEGVTQRVISVETNSSRAAYACLCRG